MINRENRTNDLSFFQGQIKYSKGQKAKKIRQEFIAKYIDAETECYNHIKNIDPHAVVSNQTYVYLRDTLKEKKRHLVSYEKALEWLHNKNNTVYIMWDISSRFKKGFENEDEKLLIKHKYTCETILEISSPLAAKMIEASNDESKYICYSDRVLPEDIYVFDREMSFYFSFTHGFLEWEGNVPKNRIVYSSIEMA